MPQYKIKSGDTLSQIAKSKGFTLNQLKSANPNITDMNKIKADNIKVTLCRIKSW